MATTMKRPDTFDDLQSESDLACCASNLRNAAMACEGAIYLSGEQRELALLSAARYIGRVAAVLARTPDSKRHLELHS